MMLQVRTPRATIVEWLKVGTIPSRRWIEASLVRVEVVRSALHTKAGLSRSAKYEVRLYHLVMTHHEIDIYKFRALERLIVARGDMRSVAIVVRVPWQTRRSDA